MSNKRLILCSVVLILMSLLPRGSATQVGNSDAYRQLELFGEVFEQIRKRYVEQVSDTELIQAAIRGMTRRLDPHSSYLAPAALESMRIHTRGRFGGLGVEITMENGQVKVIAPIEGGPAAEVGIQAGDVITHADGQLLSGLSLQEVVEKIRGQVGTTLHLTIQRGRDETLEFTVTRGIVKVRPVRHRVEREGIGYVRVSHFNSNASEALREAIQELETMVEEPGKGLILDLRNNPGGLLSQAVEVADLFLEQGEIVSVRGREPDGGQRYNATPGDILNGQPLVILINGGAASASEVVSGAMQDHQRAIILGTRSFGKGSVQRIIDLPRQQGALRLTTARYYTPSGRSIQQVGVTPDFVVPAVALEFSSTQRVREENLPGAIDEDNRSDGTAGQAGVRRSDHQLERAIDLLQGIWLYSSR